MISWENYEEYMIMYADGELQPAEERELMAFINAYPQLKNELSAYGTARLQPDEKLHYPDKNFLFKQAPEKRMVIFPAWTKYSAAAGIAALIFFSVLKFKEGSENMHTVVKNDDRQSGAQTLSGNLPAKQPLVSAPLIPAPAPAKEQKVVATHIAEPHNPHKAVSNITAQTQRKAATMIDNTAPVREIAQIQAVPVEKPKELESKRVAQFAALINVPGLPEPVAGEDDRRSFWDWLPMEDEKKERLHNIAGTIASVYNNTDKADDGLTNKKIDVKIENRKLKVSF